MHDIEIILNRCLGLKPDETLIIIIDPNYKELGDIFLSTAKNITKNVSILEIPEGKVNGEEPTNEATKALKEHDTAIILTKKSLSHTNARKEASKSGTRIASMPGFTQDMLTRCIDIDYEKMNQLNNQLADLLDEANQVRITTESGTNLTFSIKDRLAHGRHAGVFLKPGQYGNLPDGETFISPLEGTANGTYIIDGSIAREGLVDTPITVTVKNGYAIKIEGKETAKILKETLESIGKDAFNIAEFGIGTNPKAKITGAMLEDEKAIETIHIAFGNNSGFGGNINVPLHIDCLIKSPDVYLDNKKIMSSGKLLL